VAAQPATASIGTIPSSSDRAIGLPAALPGDARGLWRQNEMTLFFLGFVLGLMAPVIVTGLRRLAFKSKGRIGGGW
jgi:hypothetical protein